MWTGTALASAADPLPLIDGVSGAPWIPMADAPVDKLKMPIDSLESTELHAVLWHQGGSDALANTPANTYATLTSFWD